MSLDDAGTGGRRTPRWQPAGLLRRLLGGGRGGGGGGEPDLVADLVFARMSRAGYRTTTAPGIDQAGERLTRKIRTLSAAGALDEGSGDVFDAVINSWDRQWDARLESEHEARVSYLRQRELLSLAYTLELARLASSARRELAETEQEIEDLMAVSGREQRPAARPGDGPLPAPARAPWTATRASDEAFQFNNPVETP